MGLNLFIASNIAQEKFEVVVKDVIPYFLVYVSFLILFILIPKILTIFI
ncbi:MAG: TRAP transporter large permease subunit [Desulfobacter sp.]|nr:TRAP transporter large permease subunit [Desulfobacter sp.]WDP86385.1 MAG: TRAP transporter large permease subunit [Desulfobacter sp.]